MPNQSTLISTIPTASASTPIYSSGSTSTQSGLITSTSGLPNTSIIMANTKTPTFSIATTDDLVSTSTDGSETQMLSMSFITDDPQSKLTLTTNSPYVMYTTTSPEESNQKTLHSGTSVISSNPTSNLTATDGLIATSREDSKHSTTAGYNLLQPDQGNTNIIIDFFGQPFGKSVASVALATLALVGGRIIWKLIYKSGMSCNVLIMDEHFII